MTKEELMEGALTLSSEVVSGRGNGPAARSVAAAILSHAVGIREAARAGARDRKRKQRAAAKSRDVTPDVTVNVTPDVTPNQRDNERDNRCDTAVLTPPLSEGELFSSSDLSSSSLSLTASKSAKPVSIRSARTREPAPTAETWAAYSEAYEARYHVEPTSNARVNGQLAQFVKRVRRDEAPAIAAWYVLSNNARYVASRHSIGNLLQDAEGIRTDWVRGQQTTASAAQRADKLADRVDQYEDLRAELRARDAARMGQTNG